MTFPSFPRASIELVEAEVSELETRLEKVTLTWREDPGEIKGHAREKGGD